MPSFEDLTARLDLQIQELEPAMLEQLESSSEEDKEALLERFDACLEKFTWITRGNTQIPESASRSANEYVDSLAMWKTMYTMVVLKDKKHVYI